MDFAALASRMAAGLEGIRACLIVSGDGLSLGAYPEHSEPSARSVWERLSAVGDPQRGFFSVGDELWVVARRGWYAALLIASPTVKPGLALDRLESYLRTAEEARVREASELSGVQPSMPEATRRLRTPLHREHRSEPPRQSAPPEPPSPPTITAPGPRPPVSRPAPAPAVPAPPTASPVPPRPEPAPEPVAPPPVEPEQVETFDGPSADPTADTEPSVKPPAPEPPPVARLEPENEAPRPQTAAAAPDLSPASEVPPGPRVEAVATEVVEAAETEGQPRAETPPGEVVVDMTRADRARIEKETEAQPAEVPQEEVKERPDGSEVDKVALTREFSQLFGDIDGRDQG